MTGHLILTFAFLPFGLAAPATAQAPGSGSPTVQIPQPVTVDGRPLAPGTYEVRLTRDRPVLPSGEPSATQRWVEILAGGTVVAREIADMAVPDPSARPLGSGTHVIAQLLKEGDFVRVSIWEGNQRYLLYLPAAGTAAAAPPSGALPEGATPR